MTLKKNKDVLTIQLETIFADLQRIDDEIKCINQNIVKIFDKLVPTPPNYIINLDIIIAF